MLIPRGWYMIVTRRCNDRISKGEILRKGLKKEEAEHATLYQNNRNDSFVWVIDEREY